MDDRIITGCPLFKGLKEGSKEQALRFFSADTGEYVKGSSLNTPDEKLPFFGLVLTGIVHVLRYDLNGQSMMMAGVEPGSTFGESLNYLSLPAHVCIEAATDCAVLRLRTDRLRRHELSSPLDFELASRFTAMLAAKTLEMNDRIQVLSKLTLRAKLITYFSQCLVRYGASTFELPYDREKMAAYFGCDRSALSRELSRMRSDGVIDFRKNLFTIKKDIIDG